MNADLVFRAVDLLDGDQPRRRATVAVSGDLISFVGGHDEAVPDAREVVDGTGLLLCPGFIDMHAHSALEPFSRPQLLPKVSQGFTTELLHPDGLAPAPVEPARLEDRRTYLRGLEGEGPERWGWSTFAEYLEALAGCRPATTQLPSAGHGAIRDYVIGSGNRAPDAGELARMREELERCIEAGARTLSFGMIYLPGLYAATAELEALAEVAAAAGIPLVPHVRNEGEDSLEAIGEFIGIAERTGAPLHLSHLKLIGNSHLVEPLLALLDDARERIDLSFDQYPYGAGSTVMTALLPAWALEGGAAAVLGRLRDRDSAERIRTDMNDGLPGWENLFAACGPDRIVVADAASARGDAIGRTLADVADESGRSPEAEVLALLEDTELDVTMVDHYASDEVVRALFSHPAGLVGSDGIFGERPHPRLHGTAARVLGRFAIKDGLVSETEAVARLSSRAADRLGLRDRGRVREGLRADLVLIDPERYVDTATYEDPARTPPGVERVVIAGRSALPGGGERSGTVLTQRPETPTRSTK